MSFNLLCFQKTEKKVTCSDEDGMECECEGEIDKKNQFLRNDQYTFDVSCKNSTQTLKCVRKGTYENHVLMACNSQPKVVLLFYLVCVI